MRTISATEASRRFSDLLDSIEAGESVVITRGNRHIAEVRPAVQTGRILLSRDAQARFGDLPGVVAASPCTAIREQR